MHLFVQFEQKFVKAVSLVCFVLCIMSHFLGFFKYTRPEGVDILHFLLFFLLF